MTKEEVAHKRGGRPKVAKASAPTVSKVNKAHAKQASTAATPKPVEGSTAIVDASKRSRRSSTVLPSIPSKKVAMKSTIQKTVSRKTPARVVKTSQMKSKGKASITNTKKGVKPKLSTKQSKSTAKSSVKKSTKKVVVKKRRRSSDGEQRKRAPRKKRTYELSENDCADDCSLGSGLLDENVCYSCGQDTEHAVWETLIVCDACEGDRSIPLY